MAMAGSSTEATTTIEVSHLEPPSSIIIPLSIEQGLSAMMAEARYAGKACEMEGQNKSQPRDI